MNLYAQYDVNCFRNQIMISKSGFIMAMQFLLHYNLKVARIGWKYETKYLIDSNTHFYFFNSHDF